MQRKGLRKSELKHVRLDAPAKFYSGGKDAPGPELPQIDDDWVVEKPITDAGLFVISTRSHHRFPLANDHIHGFTTDPMRGNAYGVLSLTVQVHIGGNDVWITPGVRPQNEKGLVSFGP